MSDISEIALVVINGAEDYQDRLATARSTSPHVAAMAWAGISGSVARKLAREFGDAYTVADILRAAAEMAEYYCKHVAEIDRAADRERVA